MDGEGGRYLVVFVTGIVKISISSLSFISCKSKPEHVFGEIKKEARLYPIINFLYIVVYLLCHGQSIPNGKGK